MDKELQKLARDQIALEINNLLKSRIRKTCPVPLIAQITLANLLAEAKKFCQLASIPYYKWVKDNIKRLTIEECKRLACAGEEKDPEKAILKRRERNRQVNIEYRKRKKRDKKTSEFIKRRFDDLPAVHKKKFLKSVCSDFPAFEDYDEEAVEIVESIRRKIGDDGY